MKMTVLEMRVRELERHPEGLTRAIEGETGFGMGATLRHRRHYEVMDGDPVFLIPPRPALIGGASTGFRVMAVGASLGAVQALGGAFLTRSTGSGCGIALPIAEIVPLCVRKLGHHLGSFPTSRDGFRVQRGGWVRNWWCR